MKFEIQSKTVRTSFSIGLPLFFTLMILVIPNILSAGVAFTASPNVLVRENSDTYAGYVGNTFESNISYVQASWMVPTLKCASTSTPQSQFLVGFGGWNGGFAYSCSGGIKSIGEYSALYLVNSFYGPVPSGDHVFAGDKMTVSVGVFANVWKILLKDKTQGWQINNVSEGISQGNIFFFTLAGSIPNPDFGAIKVTKVCVTAVTNCDGLKYYASNEDFSLAEYNWINPSTSHILASATNFKRNGSSFSILWNASS